MATLYPSGKAAFLAGDIDLTSDTIKAVLVKAAYVYSAAHDFSGDLGANAVGTPATLANPDVTDGVFTADDPTFAAVGATTPCDRVAIYKHVTDGTDSPLLALLDLATAITPDGGDITLLFDAAGGIFSFNG